jgi:hypothetical protein
MMLSVSWSCHDLPPSRDTASPGDGQHETQSVSSAKNSGNAGVSAEFFATGGFVSSVQVVP